MRKVLQIALVASSITAAALTAPPAEAGRGFSVPADFEMTNCWYTSTFDPGCPWTESVLQADGTWEHVELHIPGVGDLPYTIYGDWWTKKGGKKIVIEYEGTYVTTTWKGNRTSTGCYAGTMSSTDGATGVWEGCVVY